MILVTGGTGLVGSHLLYKLLQTEENVRAIYRRKHKLDAVKQIFSYYTNDAETLYNKIEWIEADIINVPQLETAFTDVTTVYHCAAFVSFEPDKFNQLKKINTEGTANIVNLCLSFNVKKLCYVSSIAAIGKTNAPKKLIEETTIWNPEDDNSVYAITKYGAELEVWRGTQEGLPAVIVNPGIIIGPGFWKKGSSNLFKKIYDGFNYYTEGTSGYVDVDDVVNVMVKLMNSNIKNEGFILVAKNLSFRLFNEMTAKALKISTAQKLIKPWHLSIFWRLDWIRHYVFGKRRQLSKQLAKSITTTTNYDNSKIKAILDFEFTPIEVSIQKTAELFLRDQIV